MVDDYDVSNSTLRLLASRELKRWDNSAVLSLLRDSDDAVRTLAARELHLRDDKVIFDEIVGLKESDVDYLREICAFVLGQLGTPKMPFRADSIPVLAALIADSSIEVRATAAAAIGHLYYDGIPESLERLLFCASGDEEKEVRGCVAISLGHATNKADAIKKLNELLCDPDSEVRDCAELGLDILKNR